MSTAELQLEILDHAGAAVGAPDLIALEPGLFVLRFETMKVLSARAALHHLITTGKVKPGDTVVDSSSGIYARALALACHELGVRCRIIGSTTIDAVMEAELELLGVELERMPSTSSLELDQSRRVARIREILAAEPEIHWMRQYHDPVHDAGYLPVGAAVAKSLMARGHDSINLVAPVGSGVSSFAVAQGISRILPSTVTGVQPFGSVTFGADHVDDPEIIIAGIGSSIPFGNVRHQAYSTIHWIGHDVACTATTTLMREHALFAGLSSGAAWAAARYERSLADQPQGNPGTVVIAPDTGHRYAIAVHARHAEHGPLSSYAPITVTDTADLARPWSRMEWNGRPAPAQAVAHEPQMRG
ncbi:pyridoxal-phosphate dependent enzyme [Demetria terragena]|uniref:pyridoxal-phosphate dependent enzyme n=1 Tax=Demetria terragena TaxID=63959 RepID=UPI00037334D7|nr:pyridoxal-phosphate dependent enzyme [Demetria terragena]